ncbi:MAG: hypothetical protein NBV67_07025 [Tagaea sp.]|nr:hypothetical protein [Tagaea sp.]
MGFRLILTALAILAGCVLAVAVMILRPQLLAYVLAIFVPCVAIFVLEGSKKRFAWIGSVALTLSAAGPIVLGALLDSTRYVMGDIMSWIVPIGAGIVGTAIAVIVPMVGESMTAREQTSQFAKLEERQNQLIAEWGEEIREPLQPSG